VVTFNPVVEAALRRDPAVAQIEKDVVDPAVLKAFGGQAEIAARI
jgi:hypothetical protein